MAEEFRVIKLQLLRSMDVAAAKGLRRNLILVTSALPGEGKTFFSMNLAMSLAMEVDFHALLVDADVLRPSVLRRFGLAEDVGLLDLITRPELDVSDALLRTNVPKLSLIPAGTPSSKSPELLSSASVDKLLSELAERYPDRIVIFDAPPILVASGAPATLPRRSGRSSWSSRPKAPIRSRWHRRSRRSRPARWCRRC